MKVPKLLTYIVLCATAMTAAGCATNRYPTAEEMAPGAIKPGPTSMYSATQGENTVLIACPGNNTWGYSTYYDGKVSAEWATDGRGDHRTIAVQLTGENKQETYVVSNYDTSSPILRFNEGGRSFAASDIAQFANAWAQQCDAAVSASRRLKLGVGQSQEYTLHEKSANSETVTYHVGPPETANRTLLSLASRYSLSRQ